MSRAALPLLALLLAAPQEPPAKDAKTFLPDVKTVTLDKADRSVKDVLDEICRQTALEIEATGFDESARVAIELKDVPALQALDELCRALKTGNVSMARAKNAAERIFVDGSAARPHAVSHWKQFRLEVKDVSVTLQRSLGSSSRAAEVSLELSTQPGTRPLQMGEFRVEEAVDDTGWSMMSASARETDGLVEGEEPNSVVFEGRFRGRSDALERGLAVPLLAPAEGATTIARLRGRILFRFPKRFVADTVPAAQLVPGKEIRIGPIRVTFDSLEQGDKKAKLVYRTAGVGDDDGFSSFPDFTLVDDKGEPLSRSTSASGSASGMKVEYTLARDAPVAGLRYEAYVGRVTIAVPVDLRDIPLPRKK